MKDLTKDIDELKQKYRRIFLKTGEELGKRIEQLEHDNFKKFFEEEITDELYEKWHRIIKLKENFSCTNCGACCKLACSEFSPQELLSKSQNKDNFATQFTKTFVPYENKEEAKEIYPEYFELLKTQNTQDVYFYHCPKVKNNLCPDYQNRPQICKDFPDNPLAFLPKTCGYWDWKKQTEEIALEIQATGEIINYYKQKLNN